MNHTTLLQSITGFGFDTLTQKLLNSFHKKSEIERRPRITLPHPNPIKLPMTLFPNPAVATDPVKLSFGQITFGNIFIKIFNQQGKCVLTNVILNSDGITSHLLNIQNLEHGIYDVQMQTNGQTGNQKLIVQ